MSRYKLWIVGIRHYIMRKLRDLKFRRWAEICGEEERSYADRFGAPELTKEEHRQIVNAWGGVLARGWMRTGIPAFKAWKMNYGFDAHYVPFSYFFPWVMRILNPIDIAKVFSRKELMQTIFHDIKQPDIILRCVGGIIFSHNGSVLNCQEAVRLIGNVGCDVVVKPSTNSYCGKNVRFVSKKENPSTIESVIQTSGNEYIVQRALRQVSYTSAFNKSSLNTFRISTLLLNGKFSVLTAMLRFGNVGSVVDNVGAGGACVGINADGTLMPYGFKQSGERISSWNGVKFDGYQIRNWSGLTEAARQAHSKIPHCAFVGWDFALDESEDVNLIEANIDWPGIFFEQLANGRTLFGERFNEVVEYIKEHPLPMTGMSFTVL